MNYLLSVLRKISNHQFESLIWILLRILIGSLEYEFNANKILKSFLGIKIDLNLKILPSF